MTFNFDLLINIVILLVQLYIGLIVIFHDPKGFSNKFFLILVLFVVLHGIIHAFFVSTTPYNDLDLYKDRARISIALVPPQLLFLFLFLLNFPKKKLVIKLQYFLVLLGITLALMFLAITPLVFSGYEATNFIPRPIHGPLFPIFASSLSILVLANLVTIFIRYFITLDETLRQHISIIGAGIAISFASLFLSQFILPNYFGITTFLNFISLFMLPMIIAIGYAIVGYRIFDIRVIPAEVFTLLIWILFIISIFSRPTESFIGQLFILALIILLGLLLTRNIASEVKQRDILQRLTKNLEETNKKLEDLNRLKSEFLSFASHQVKSPMAIAKGYSELIIDEIEGVPEQAKDFAKKIKNNIDRLLVLIEEFMDYRRIDEGRMEFNFEKVDIVSLIKEICENMKLLAKEKKLEFNLETKIDSAILNLDKVRFTQVIQNLIDNAIKYTKTGWVKVDVDKKENKILICVSDSGRGMSKELQSKLFSQFVRDTSIKKEVQGTGLGLYIAKFIVEAHKGKIWAESEGIDHGSRFFVEIPMET